MTIKTRTGARHANDLYPTPPSVCAAAMDWLPPTTGRALDVGAGDGVWGQALKAHAPDSTLVGVDVRRLPAPPAYDFWFFDTDFLAWPKPHPADFDLIIGNPPYKHAEMFIHHALRLLAPGGTLLFLLRLDFLGGVGRAESLWPHTPLAHVVVGADRIHFTGSRPTHHHAFFIWQYWHVGSPALHWTRFERPHRVYDERKNQLELFAEESP